MPARSIKVWNSTSSEWEDVAVASPDTSSFVQNSLVNAKGDLVTATANDTPAILTAGSNGQMLMADSSATAGLRYVDPPANRRLTINGDMQVHQRGTSKTAITTTGYYTADRWQLELGSLGTWTQTVEDDAPTGSGFRKSLKLLCTTAKASPGANDSLSVYQRLEGQDLQRIRKGTSDAQQLTLSFWVKANVTGTYTVILYDADNARMVGSSYTISQSATWERKTITFAADASGAFDNDNAASLDLYFQLGLGSVFTSGTLRSTWTAYANGDRGPGQTNLAAATNNYWQITGVQLETGIATPFEFEPYETTLRKCQRYYWRETRTASGQGDVLGGNMGAAVTTTVVDVNVPYPTRMRTAPSALEVGNLAAYGWRLTTFYSTGTWTIAFGSDRSATLRYTHGTGVFTINDVVSVMSNTAGASHIAFSAEL